jgi:hypothetical protein
LGLRFLHPYARTVDISNRRNRVTIDILKDYYFIQGMTFMVTLVFSTIALLFLLYKPRPSAAEEAVMLAPDSNHPDR